MTSLVDRLLPEELWQRIQPLLPAPPPRSRGGVPRRVPNRNCAAALVFMAAPPRLGACCRPRSLGCGSATTCWRRLDEYGLHRLRRRSLFELDLVRQFEVVDAEGDHDHYVQMHCTLRYAPTPELAALGADQCWWFPDQGALAAWLHSVAARPEWAVLDAQKPKQVAVHQEDV